MRASASQNWILLAIIVGHLGILCAATLFPTGRCRFYDRRYFGHMHPWRCSPHRMPTINTCSIGESLCSAFPDFRDCLLPQFQCSGDGRCIRRSRYCDGFIDCDDGSDEWECDTYYSDSTTTSSMRSESLENTFSYITTISTMLGGNEEKTTSVILLESEENASSLSTTTSTILPNSESNTVLSSSTTTSTMLPDSEENTSSLSTTISTVVPHSKSNTVLSSSTRISTILPNSESNTVLSSSTTTRTMLPDSEENTSSLSTTTSTMLPAFESNTALSTSATAKTTPPDSETNTSLSFLVPDNIMLPESDEKTSSPTTNTIFPDPSAMQSCPDSYCMQNAECIVVQGQYHCKCPSSFSGELCEIQLETEQGSHEYAVAIVIFMTLVILCLAVVSVCIYRHKRLSAWKSGDRTTRTLSQLTLTFNAVE